MMSGTELIATIAFYVICLAGIVLNGFEIASLLRAKKTKLPFDITLISLAASDLITTLTVSCSFIFSSIQQSRDHSIWYVKLFSHVIAASGICSALHMIFIAIQRLVAVLYPMKLSIWITKKRSILTVAWLWLVSIVAIVPIINKVYSYQRGITYLPLGSIMVLLLCYIVINYKTMTRKRLSVSQNSTQNLQVLLYSICVTTIFIGCTLPYTIECIINEYRLQSLYALILYLLQVIFNPILYYLFHFLKKKECIVCCRMYRTRAVSMQQRIESNVSQET